MANAKNRRALVLPNPIIDRMKEVSTTLGIPMTQIACTAILDYLERTEASLRARDPRPPTAVAS